MSVAPKLVVHNPSTLLDTVEGCPYRELSSGQVFVLLHTFLYHPLVLQVGDSPQRLAPVMATNLRAVEVLNGTRCGFLEAYLICNCEIQSLP